jgi:hypothetical protein
LLISIDTYLGLAVHSISNEVASFNEFLTNDLMEAGIFVSRRLPLPLILSCAKLPKVLSSFRTYISE